ETLLAVLRAAARGARLRRLPGRAPALSPRLPARHAPPRDLELPRAVSVRGTRLPRRARGDRPSARARPAGDPERRRRGVPAAQGRARSEERRVGKEWRSVWSREPCRE